MMLDTSTSLLYMFGSLQKGAWLGYCLNDPMQTGEWVEVRVDGMNNCVYMYLWIVTCVSATTSFTG